MTFLRKSAKQGYVDAETLLGTFHGDVEMMQSAAEKGSAYAQWSLGLSRRDQSEALECYLKAAKQGYVPGQLSAAKLYQDETFTNHNDEEAVRWYQKAAEQGAVEGQIALGRYCRAKGTVDGLNEAIKWFRLAADQTNALGNLLLANIYLVGAPGVHKDFKKAEEHYFRAAKGEGNPSVDFEEPGESFMRGIRCEFGVSWSLNEAAHYYREAASKTNALAEFRLGTFFKEGKGVPEDRIEAYKYMSLASTEGMEAAAVEKQELARQMNPSEIAEAEQRRLGIYTITNINGRVIRNIQIVLISDTGIFYAHPVGKPDGVVKGQPAGKYKFTDMSESTRALFLYSKQRAAFEERIDANFPPPSGPVNETMKPTGRLW